METPVLVSLCLLGVSCRYDGTSCYVPELTSFLLREFRSFVALCPEVEGCLSTPRPSAEIQQDNQIVNIRGENITSKIEEGTRKVIQIVQKYNVCQAVLKAYSPSCGYGEIYNGTFSGTLVPGKGICASSLEKIGVKIGNEKNWRDFLVKNR